MKRLLNILIDKLYDKQRRDCVVCAFRPSIVFSIFDIYLGLPVCQHVEGVRKAGLKEMRWTLLISVLLKCILMINVYYEYKALKTSVVENTIEIIKRINMVLFTMSFLVHRKAFQEYFNYFVGLTEKRRLFGMDTIIDSQTTFVCRFFTVLFIIRFICTGVFRTLFLPSIKAEGLLDVVSILIVIYTLTNIGIYAFTSFETYASAFHAYSDNVKQCLAEALHSKENAETPYDEDTLSDRLRYSRQFYLNLCRIFKKRALAGNALYYAEQMTEVIALCIVTVIYMTFYFQVNWLLKTSWLIQSLSNFVAMIYIGKRTHTIMESGKDLISYLNSYPISKLTDLEAAQVEILIITLTLEKPELTASNLFTLGTNLISSITGNVVTYVLVTLQFHEFFAEQ